MSGSRSWRIILWAATIAVASSASIGARAQPARIRTLIYDTDRKEWVEKPRPQPGTAEGDLHAIRELTKDGAYRKALAAHKAFVKKYGLGDPHYPAGLIAKAETLVAGKDYEKAHNVLQTFLGEFGGMELTTDALRLEFEVAEAFLAGAKRKVWGVFRLSGVDLAYRILDEISTDHPESRLAELAIKVKADHQFKVGDHALAELDYSRLLREYPQSRYQQYAFARAAESALASFAGAEFDEAALIEAQERYNDYRVRYPAAAEREGVELILDTIHEARAEKESLIGEYYERTDHLSSAVFYYEAVRREYPETLAAAKARSRLELLGALPSPADKDNATPRIEEP